MSTDTTPSLTSLEQQVKELSEALEACPLPSTLGNVETHYQRFYDWYNRIASPALAKVQQS